MVNIEMNQNDRGMLLRILDNYITYRKIDCKNGRVTDKELEYDLTNIHRLVDTIKGNRQVEDDIQLQSKEFREKNGRIKNSEFEEVKLPTASLPFKTK